MKYTFGKRIKRDVLREHIVSLSFLDLAWAACLSAFFVVCIELFYRMIVNYNHKYPSDFYFYAVTNVQNNTEHNRLVCVVYQALYDINQSNIEITIFSAFVIVLIILANYGTIRFVVDNDGYHDRIPRCAIEIASVAALFMGPIYVPFIYERYYKHTFKSFAWHSPTQQLMTFFALVASICFIKMFLEYEKGKLSARWWIATALMLFLATYSKPSFTINYAIAITILFLIELFSKGKEDFLRRFGQLFIMGCTLIPSGIYMILLHNSEFTEGTQFGEEHAVLIDFSHVIEYSNLFRTIVFCLAIPIVVFAFNSERFKDVKYRYALLVFLMGMLQWAMFTETGKRGNYGNFIWGRTYGIYYINLVAAVVAMEIFFDKNGKFSDNKKLRAVYLFLIAAIMVASIVSQLNYFRLVLTGHGYQL